MTPTTEAPEKRHDMILVILSTLVHHERDFALTGGALRRLAYAATGRGDAGSGYTVGFRRLIRNGLVTAKGQPRVGARETYVITDEGRKALGKKPTVLRAHDVDPDGWLKDAHRYHRSNLKTGE